MEETNKMNNNYTKSENCPKSTKIHYPWFYSKNLIDEEKHRTECGPRSISN